MESLTLLGNGTLETMTMVLGGMLVGIIGGLPLGVILYTFSSQGLHPLQSFYRGLGFFVNIIRSIPYIILTIGLIPFTRLVVGSSIGTYAAIVPLGLAAIFLIARATEAAMQTVTKERIEIGTALSAPSYRILISIVLCEALPVLVNALTTIMIQLIGFSAMAGIVGGGGLGDLAFRYGYQRYDTNFMLMVVGILVVLVQCVQSSGSKLQRWLEQPT